MRRYPTTPLATPEGIDIGGLLVPLPAAASADLATLALIDGRTAGEYAAQVLSGHLDGRRPLLEEIYKRTWTTTSRERLREGIEQAIQQYWRESEAPIGEELSIEVYSSLGLSGMDALSIDFSDESEGGE